MYFHQPVLLKEAIYQLKLFPGAKVIDGTIGGGGHAQKILENIGANGFLWGFDLDPEAILECNKKLVGKNRLLINDNYANLPFQPELADMQGKINAILVDLGVSSYEITDANRGFSFQKENEDLDLRMNPVQKISAQDILNNNSEEEIVEILRDYGEEPLAKDIARQIRIQRQIKKVTKVRDLLKIIELAYRGKHKPKKIHYATRTWQALRIAVNQELDNLKKFLPKAISFLAPQGRLAVISFHSLEDRIVKKFFLKEASTCICPSDFPVCCCHHQASIKVITKKPIIPSIDELRNNYRAHSAKLRIAEKI